MSASDYCFGCVLESYGELPNEIYKTKWADLKTKFSECVAAGMDRVAISKTLYDLFVCEFVAQLQIDHVRGAEHLADRWTSDRMYEHFTTHSKEQ